VTQDWETHRIIFVGGLHRSGTSLLHRCIRDHPEASGFENTGAPEDEGQHLQSVYPRAFKYGGPAKFGFAQQMRLDEDCQLATDENARKLFGEWSPHWDLTKPNLVEKSPPNVIKSRFLQRLFPEARFVFILRHPVAVTLATLKWKPRMPLSKFVEHWLTCHEKMRSDLDHLNHATVLRYEDFIADPNQTIADLFAFLELSPNPVEQEVRTGVNDKYFEMWGEKTQGFFKSRKRDTLVAAFEDRAQAFGYSLANLSHDPSWSMS